MRRIKSNKHIYRYIHLLSDVNDNKKNLLAPNKDKRTLIKKSAPHPLLINTARGGKKKAITKSAISLPE